MNGPLSWFDRLIVPLLGGVAGVILFVMMVLTCTDVVGRYFLSAPVRGAFEVTEVLLACLIFTGLPLVTLRQEHITVDVLDGVTPDWLLRIQHVLACLVAGIATAYLAWRLSVRGDTMMASGETTAQLKLPLFWLTYAMCVLMALTSLAFLILVFRRPSRQATGEV
jgi:TRAP-type C4-dicarboxylate transport system permease small subunit